MPWLPTAYMSSVFSRKMIQSIFSLGMRTGPDVGKKIKGLAHGHIRALDVGPAVALLRGVGWALERDVALSNLFKDVVGYCLQLFGAVLYG